MKKIFFWGVLAVAAMTSCSQNEVLEVSERNAINFRVTTEHASRAVEYYSTNLMPEVNVTAMKGDNTHLFRNKTWTNTDGTWGTNGLVFWPNSTDELSFYGYFPTDLTEDLKVTDFEPAEYAKQQVDVMAAFNKCAQGTQGTVSLHFKHLLSQIAVKAKNMNENYTVKVKGVKLSGFKTNASIDLPSEVTKTGTSVTETWSAMTETAYYVAEKAEVTLTSTPEHITGTNADGIGTFMVLPQQLEAWDGFTYGESATGAYIGVLCQITRNTDDVIIYPKQEANTNAYAYAAVPIDTKLEMGTKYIYTLTFFNGKNGGAGYVDPKPDEGQDVDGDNKDDAVDKPVVDDGTEDGYDEGPIISTKAITVDVTCNDWYEVEVEKDMAVITHESVNINGVEWATMNIGAATETEIGDYFAWGETSSKSNYLSTNYTAPSTTGDLTAEYDAATVNWGPEWRMPTKKEVESLIPLGKVTTNYNGSGVGGWIITDSQDPAKQIFLPFTGRKNDYRLNYTIYGFYWTSTYNTEKSLPYYMRFLNNTMANDEASTTTSYYGFPIRPVRVSSK